MQFKKLFIIFAVCMINSFLKQPKYKGMDMKANIVSKNEREVVIQVKISLESSMLETEESVQESSNQAGCQAAEIALSRYDTNGDPITVNDLKHTSKGLIEKIC
ncbi:MAG: hypothetical protein GY696_34330, partial [Gammaproteobacteria bacterium]|nr:hypothetical protein [Gammaproteobacteria bacterium]